MPPLVVPDAMLVTCKGTVLGSNWANVYGLDVGSAFLMAQSVADEIAAQFSTFYTTLRTSLATNWTFDECVVSDLRTGTSPSYDGAVTPFSGTQTGDFLAPNFAIVASHSTGFRGKSYRGRTYLCGWTEAANDAQGSVASTYQTLIEDAFDQLRADLLANVTNGAELAVVSRALLEVNPIIATTVDPEWDHQDRRKRA